MYYNNNENQQNLLLNINKNIVNNNNNNNNNNTNTNLDNNVAANSPNKDRYNAFNFVRRKSMSFTSVIRKKPSTTLLQSSSNNVPPQEGEAHEEPAAGLFSPFIHFSQNPILICCSFIKQKRAMCWFYISTVEVGCRSLLANIYHTLRNGEDHHFFFLFYVIFFSLLLKDNKRAKFSSVSVLSVDYTLSPEVRYPVSVRILPHSIEKMINI